MNYILDYFTTNIAAVFSYISNPGERIFFLYLATSLLFTLFIYLKINKVKLLDLDLKAFLLFLFPKKVWDSPSAWLDIRYFFFHQILFRSFIYGPFKLTLILSLVFYIPIFLTSIFGQFSPVEISLGLNFFSAVFVFVIYMTYVLLNDLITYYIHYLQHHNRFLWIFHKVHHSSTVLSPVSNYREHPVDNLLYAILSGGFAGLYIGISLFFFKIDPAIQIILGLGIVGYFFNIFAYHLRHSHIWLKWPGIFSKIFGSPAHHQIHHSYSRSHINTNFGFIFSFWDVIFGTYSMDSNNSNLKIGLNERENELNLYNSCLKIYFVPFKKIFTSFKP